MKTAQTKIDVSKGVLTIEFDGDVINFNVYESVKYPNDVRSCFSINVIENIRQENSTPIKNDVFKTTIEKGIGVDHTGQATALKAPKAESTTSEIFDRDATFESSSQYIGEPPIPIPISFQLIGCYLLWFRCPIESKLVVEFTFTLGSSMPQLGRVTNPFNSYIQCIEVFKEDFVEDVPFHAAGHSEA
ncbi:hypothetical protein ACFX1X_041154 [Malus domestica]